MLEDMVKVLSLSYLKFIDFYSWKLLYWHIFCYFLFSSISKLWLNFCRCLYE